MVGWPAKPAPTSAERALDQDHITPFAVERAVAKVRSAPPEPAPLHQPHARVVAREQPARELVEPASLSLAGECRQQGRPDAAAAQLGIDVHAALRDAGVDVTGAVLGGRRPAGDPVAGLGHEERVALGADPLAEFSLRPLARLERGRALADAGVVDVRDRGGVLGSRGADLHRYGPGSAVAEMRTRL